MANEFMSLMDEAMKAIIEKRAEELASKTIDAAVSNAIGKHKQKMAIIEEAAGVLPLDTLLTIGIYFDIINIKDDKSSKEQGMAEVVLLAIEKALEYGLKTRNNPKRIESLKMAKLNLTAKVLSGKKEE